MDLFTFVSWLGMDTGAHEPPFFAWADRVYAKCARFCMEIAEADAERARQEARLRDYEKTLEEAERWN